MLKPQKRDLLRAALLGAAEKVIEENGFQALRARDLTQAAGCALGALYNVFPDMDALIIAVKLRILDQLDETMRAAAAPLADMGAALPEAERATLQLLALADAYLDFAVRNHRRWQTLFKHQQASGGPMPEDYLARLGEIFAHVEAPLASILPQSSVMARAVTGRALFAGVHGVVLLGLEQRLGQASQDLIRAQFHILVASAIAGLRANPAMAEPAPGEFTRANST